MTPRATSPWRSKQCVPHQPARAAAQTEAATILYLACACFLIVLPRWHCQVAASAAAGAFRVFLMPVDAMKTIMQVNAVMLLL